MTDPVTEAIDPQGQRVETPEQLWDLFEQQESVVQRALGRVRQEVLELSKQMADTLTSPEGRIIGLGAGTSGRLLALDMAEWGPTFSVPARRRLALIAGGDAALTEAVEGAEDDGEAALRVLDEVGLNDADLVIGVSASGSAAWVREGLRQAREEGCSRAFISSHSPVAADSWLQGSACLILETGAEPVAGSTRLKAATATHRLLQRASTLCALRCGWIHRGRMVRMQATNRKLRRRALEIVVDLTPLDEIEAKKAISLSEGDLRLAIAIAHCGMDRQKAEQALIASGGHLGPIEANSG